MLFEKANHMYEVSMITHYSLHKIHVDTLHLT